MSFDVTTDLALCVPRTADYVQLFGEENSPRGRKIINTGFLSMLRDSNYSRYTQMSDFITGVPGKKRGVKVLFKQPLCFTVCATEFACDETRQSYSTALKVAEFELETRYTPCKTSGSPAVTSPAEFKLTAEEFAAYCDIEDANLVKEEIIDYDIEFINQLDKNLLTLADAYVKTANTFSRAIVVKNALTNSYQLNTAWELMIEQDVVEAGMNIDNYVIIGGLFTKLVNALGGSKIPTYYDANADSIIGKYGFLLVPKGLFQLVFWNDFVGSRAFMDKRYEQSTKVIPLANGGALPIDYFWEFEPKCGEYKYMPQIYAELIKAVDGTCGDTEQDGLFKYTNCTEDIWDCPST